MRNLAILLVLLWSTAAGAVPGTINFTGRLSTSTGPVTGSVDITLRLYPEADKGTALWSEVQRGVGVDNGLVFLELGKETTLDENILDGRRLFLEIVVGSERLDPRLPLNSVPYAVRTDAAATADSLGGITAADVVTSVNSGAGVVATRSSTNGVSVSLSSCSTTGQILKWNQTNATWTCQPDNGATYTAPTGSGINVNNSTTTISLTSCSTTGQILKWNQTSSTWTCQPDDSTNVTAGAGIAVSGSTVSLTSCTTTGQILKWNQTNATWTCQPDNGTSYTGPTGSGINVNNSTATISLTSCTATGQILKWNQTSSTWTCQPDDNTTPTAGAGIAVSGSTVSLTSCTTTGQVLKWNQTSSTWTCQPDNGTTYTAPTGSGINVNNTSATISLSSCTATGQILKWNQSNSTWGCGADNDTAPGATPPLNVASNTVSISGCPNGSQILRWNGTQWQCSSDFTATSCIWKSVTGPTSSGTALSVACPTGKHPISGGCDAALPNISVITSRPFGPPTDGTAASAVNQWSCEFTTASTAHRAFALCCDTI